MKTQHDSKKKDFMDTYPQKNYQEKKKVHYIGKPIPKRQIYLLFRN